MHRKRTQEERIHGSENNRTCANSNRKQTYGNKRESDVLHEQARAKANIAHFINPPRSLSLKRSRRHELRVSRAQSTSPYTANSPVPTYNDHLWRDLK